ncbi:nuclear RNA export factor 1-like [Cylas formicarius]|uniref:nuclear RNA export factor 1-like n=1 Tax=Cylas formicarius TaxID=197179 RepID=UPI002958A23C|nr:nuclear RNA export factor 1-like [Cylas formicarius]
MSAVNILTLSPKPGSVLVNNVTLAAGITLKNRQLLRNVRYWHKFTVSNTDGLSRNEILKAILDHVHPLDLIPVFFVKENTSSNSYFLARNCEAAIDKLCNDNLIVDHPWNKNSANKKHTPFKLSILLNFSTTNEIKIDVQKNVMMVLSKRYDNSTKTLDCEKFYDDPDLNEFCPLSQPKIMYFVLHLAKTLNPEEIILADNGIKVLNPLEVLVTAKVHSLDLSNNLISSVSELGYIRNFHLNNLNLSGNPFCLEFDEQQYISTIRIYSPNLEVLDGLLLSYGKLPLLRRNFICDDSGIDLANQFVEYYFTVYDSRSKLGLENIYDKNAMFSLTSTYHPNQLSSKTAQLKTYNVFSRNLMKCADLSRTSQFLYMSREKIVDFFIKSLPHTEHDPYTFSVDLMIKSYNLAIIVVSGVFHELPTYPDDRFLGFTRQFVLALTPEGGCSIINEQMHIHNAFSNQVNVSLQHFKESLVPLNKDVIPRARNKKDFRDCIVTLMALTNLKKDWALKCLEEGKFELKKSLELFVQLYKADKIPIDAFEEKN